ESTDSEDNNVSSDVNEDMEDAITETDKDLLGEIGNISMGSASTALYQLINHLVHSF
ncbi:Flagellar motor switch phosphatase FliY, partial [human gut metagenome]